MSSQDAMDYIGENIFKDMMSVQARYFGRSDTDKCIRESPLTAEVKGLSCLMKLETYPFSRAFSSLRSMSG